ncbi:hypothetical protein [Streptomyces sp. NPDC013171]|uniref:hypothetical protein n=1 Tax=Streptomyces sp. NPDC013171 TaxID=3364863 RepID=UPI003677813F
MKKTTRDEWRVMVTLKVRRPADLGLTGIDDLAEFIAPPGPLTIAVLPRSLGNFGFVSMSDGLVSRDIEGDYRRRCEDIADELRNRPQVEDVSVCCTETHTCSHCNSGWEELTAEEAADYSTSFDEHSVEGEPACCEAAINEFRSGRDVPALQGGGTP